MGLLRESWLNLAASLWQREAVEKLDEHERVLDESGQLIDPVPDPHPQYFHLTLDTAWAGMHLSDGPSIAPGTIIANYTENLYPDYKLTSDLVAGTITIPTELGGGYNFFLYFTFQAASNGGDFLFRVRVNGLDTALASAVSFSNQNDIGLGVITGFFPITNLIAPAVAELYFDEASDKNVSMLDVMWTISRQFPDPSTVAGQATGMDGNVFDLTPYPAVI